MVAVDIHDGDLYSRQWVDITVALVCFLILTSRHAAAAQKLRKNRPKKIHGRRKPTVGEGMENFGEKRAIEWLMFCRSNLPLDDLLGSQGVTMQPEPRASRQKRKSEPREGSSAQGSETTHALFRLPADTRGH